MADQSTQSIDIDAPASAVMAVIADFDNYPAWAGSVRKAEVLETAPDGRAKRVAFDLAAGPMRDAYQLSFVWTADSMVEWTLIEGQMMRAQLGRYLLEPTADGTHVTYWLSVDLIIPMLGRLKRKAERIVMDQALNELKKRVEAISSG